MAEHGPQSAHSPHTEYEKGNVDGGENKQEARGSMNIESARERKEKFSR